MTATQHYGEHVVRLALSDDLTDRNPTALLVTELTLDDATRVDLAVIGDAVLAGYEIKTGGDNLIRLPRQVAAYSRTLEWCSLVAHPRHLAKAVPMLPSWWGVYQIGDSDTGPVIEPVRTPEPNPEPDPRALVALLWKGEVVDALARLGYPRHVSRRYRRGELQDVLGKLPYTQLRGPVCETLMTRESWR